MRLVKKAKPNHDERTFCFLVSLRCTLMIDNTMVIVNIDLDEHWNVPVLKYIVSGVVQFY